MAFSYWDLGACNCPAACPFYPCALPRTNLTATVTIGGTATMTGVFSYSSLTGCTWSAPCSIINGSQSVQLSWGITPGGCTWLQLYRFSDSACASQLASYSFQNPANCQGLLGTTLSLGAFNCGPLSIAFGGGGATVVITP